VGRDADPEAREFRFDWRGGFAALDRRSMTLTRERRLATGAGIAIAVVSVLGFVAVPRLFHSTHSHPETSAICMLRNLCSAQHEFRERALADADGDGKGEYGLFGELSGECFVRGTKEQLDPPLLSGAFRAVDERGVIRRSGYCFRIFLPGKDGAHVTERTTAQRSVVVQRPEDRRPGCPGCGSRQVAQAEVAVTGPIETDAAEQGWYAYAWPIHAGGTETRSFYVDQDGDIYVTAERRASAPAAPPARDGRRWTLMP
jgi:hypothetical protein